MPIIHKTLPLKRKKCVAAIGVFDGVHLGHRSILSKVKAISRLKKISSLAITFDKLPQQFLDQHHFRNRWPTRKSFSGRISDTGSNARLISAAGIDYVWLLRTNKKLLELSGRDFIAYVCRYFDVKVIVAGEDFRFGYAGGENIDSLKKLSQAFGFTVKVIKKCRRSKDIVSSSLIRNLIAAGKVEEAEKFLGRKYSLSGTVVRGKQVGRKLGFPTANISLRGYVTPAEGVYAAWVLAGKKFYCGAVFVAAAKSPRGNTLIETHIIGFNRNILNRKISIFFIKKIRPRQSFANRRLLSEAIRKDIQIISSKCGILPPDNTQLVVV
jgi:riboflavin kinase / FMN adenylyltransferase